MDTVFRTVIQLTIMTKVMAFNLESFMKSLPVPADLRAMIIDIHEKQREFSIPDMDDVTATPRRRLLRTSVTLNPDPSSLEVASTTAKVPEKPLTLPPPFHQLPGMPMQIPMPMAMPVFARAPIMLPMRAYFETVKHDHPPLYKIKQMIEKDEKRWKEEEKGGDCETSVEVAYSDGSSDRSKGTDTDSEVSDYNDVGSDEYDDSVSVISE